MSAGTSWIFPNDNVCPPEQDLVNPDEDRKLKEVAKLLYEWVSNHKRAPRGRYYGSYQVPDWELAIIAQAKRLSK